MGHIFAVNRQCATIIVDKDGSLSLTSSPCNNIWNLLKFAWINFSLHMFLSIFLEGAKQVPRFCRYFDTPSLTFQNFHHIFISHTYRTMKSSFLEICEKVEGGCQNTCKKDCMKIKLYEPIYCMKIKLKYNDLLNYN